MQINETYTIEKQILHYVHLAQRNPFQPIWGEIFNILYKIKRESEINNSETMVYKVQGEPMIYLPHKKRFSLSVQGVTFNLKICELTTSILKGRFLPSNSNG